MKHVFCEFALVLAFLFHSPSYSCAKFAYIYIYTVYIYIIIYNIYICYFCRCFRHVLHQHFLQPRPGQEARFQQPSSLGMDPEGKAVTHRDTPRHTATHHDTPRHTRKTKTSSRKDQESVEERVEIRVEIT